MIKYTQVDVTIYIQHIGHRFSLLFPGFDLIDIVTVLSVTNG